MYLNLYFNDECDGISVERDESSERTMVLLVKQISPELVLSDGWWVDFHSSQNLPVYSGTQ